jgi:hypothetical protein
MSEDPIDPTTQPNGKRGTAPRDWPNTISAAAQTGLTRKQLLKLVERGALKQEKDSMGVWRWDPQQLALVAEARDGGEEDEPDADGAPSAGKPTTVLAQTVALLHQAHAHQEETFRLVRDPMKQLLDRYAAENDELRKRVKDLEGKYDDVIAAREKLLSEQHLRDQLARELAASDARKDQALALVKENVPKLLAAVNPAASNVVRLLRSLTQEQRDMLLLTDLLNVEQKDAVRSLLGPTTEPAPAAAPEEPKP